MVLSSLTTMGIIKNNLTCSSIYASMAPLPFYFTTIYTYTLNLNSHLEMPNAIEIGIIAFCILVLFAMLLWAFFWPHKHHRYGMDSSRKAAKKRSRTAGRSHHDIEMHPRNWDEPESSPRSGKKKVTPKYDSEKEDVDWV